MKSRRDFLQNAFLGSLAAGTANFWAKIAEQAAPPSKNKLPLVIATWDNRKATEAAWEVLTRGGRALDAVEAGARIPEADPDDTSVGYGGFPDRDGNVTLDACIMDEFGNAGCVTYLQHILHPISVARLIMEKTPHVMLSGDGALEFALSQGFQKENLLTETARKAWEHWKTTSKYKPVINSERHDTIGIVAMDAQQRLSGACTTSGMAFKMRGRIGDSPVIGAGMFTDNEVGAAAATGLGEMVLKTLGTFLLVEEMRRGKHPQKAAEEVVRRLAHKYPKEARENQVCYVAIDKKGRHGAFSLQPGFNYALYQADENKVLEAGSFFSK
jgi:N4-(beta-N-acetylglucosaminyl)-L-asparaginase